MTLKDWMRENRVPARVLADRVGCRRETITLVANGKTPSLHVASEIERITGIPAVSFARARKELA